MPTASFRQLLDLEMQRCSSRRPAPDVGHAPPAPDIGWLRARLLAAQSPLTPTCLRTLGVPVGCSIGDAKRAFRQLASQTHPDRAGGCEAAFMAIERAYRQAVALLSGTPPS